MEGRNLFAVFQDGLGFLADFFPVGCEGFEEREEFCWQNGCIAHLGLAAHDPAQILEQLFAIALDEFAAAGPQGQRFFGRRRNWLHIGHEIEIAVS